MATTKPDHNRKIKCRCYDFTRTRTYAALDVQAGAVSA